MSAGRLTRERRRGGANCGRCDEFGANAVVCNRSRSEIRASGRVMCSRVRRPVLELGRSGFSGSLRGVARACMQPSADPSREVGPCAGSSKLALTQGEKLGNGAASRGQAAHRVRAALPRATRRRPPAHHGHHFSSKPAASISQRTSEEAKRQPVRLERQPQRCLRTAP